MAETTARDFEALSAYVDNALSAEEAAILAQRIAAEPGLARAAARLAALKAASAARLPTDPPVPPYSLPARPLASPRGPVSPGARARRRSLAVAACLCAVVAGGAMTAFLGRVATLPVVGNPDAAGFDALALHDSWGNVNDMSASPAGFDEGRRRIMAATRLIPAFARNGGAGAKLYRQEGYIGANGCRVSLFLAPPGARLSLPSIAGDVLAASWDQDGGQFLLVARAIDPVRFAKLAAALRDAPPSGEERGDLIATLASQSGGCPT